MGWACRSRLRVIKKNDVHANSNRVSFFHQGFKRLFTSVLYVRRTTGKHRVMYKRIVCDPDDHISSSGRKRSAPFERNLASLMNDCQPRLDVTVASSDSTTTS